MSVRMRHTRAHTKNRRSHHAISEAAFSPCPNCGAPKVSHKVCEECGQYKGRQVVDKVKAVAKK